MNLRHIQNVYETFSDVFDDILLIFKMAIIFHIPLIMVVFCLDDGRVCLFVFNVFFYSSFFNADFVTENKVLHKSTNLSGFDFQLSIFF